MKKSKLLFWIFSLVGFLPGIVGVAAEPASIDIEDATTADDDDEPIILNIEDSNFNEGNIPVEIYNKVTTPYGRMEYERLGLPYPLENSEEELGQGEFSKVRDDANNVLFLAPDDVAALYLRAYSAYCMGDVKAALKDLKRVMEISEYYDFAELAGVYTLIDHIGIWNYDIIEDELAPYFAKIKSRGFKDITDDELDVYSFWINNITYGLAQDGYHNKTVGYLKPLLQYSNRLSPGEKQYIVTSLSTAYMHMMRPEAAKDVIEKYYKVGKKEVIPSGIVNNYYMALEDLGDLEGAYEFLMRQSEVMHSRFDVLCNRADFLASHGNYREAAEILADTHVSPVEMMTEDVHRALRYGRMLQLAGEEEMARKIFEMIAANPEAGSEVAFAYALLGDEENAYKHSADWKEEKALPSKATLEYLLGHEEAALDYLGQAYSLSLWYPNGSARDIFTQGIMKLPGYESVRAKFNPSR